MLKQSKKEPLLHIATFGKSVGIKGDIKFHLKTDFPEQFVDGASFLTNLNTEVTLKDVNLKKGTVKIDGINTLEDVKRVVESKSADMINIKLMKCGGVSKAVEILEYAREHNVTCMLGSMLEGPYSINAALYLAFNYRDIIKYVDLDSPLLYKESSKVLDFSFEGATIYEKKLAF